MKQLCIIHLLGLVYVFNHSFPVVHSNTGTVNNASSSSPVPQCISPESCVFEKIFTGYNKVTRPTLQHNRTIEVQVQMVFNGLMDIEEKDEYMRSVGFFRAFWYDELLQWDPAEFDDVQVLIVPADRVWTPDIGITNSVASFYEITYKRDFHLQIHYNGWIRWSFGGVLTTSCDIDLSLYPFDRQHCSVEMESWQFEKAKVTLTLSPGVAVNLDSFETDPQWILDGADGESYLKYDDRFSAIKFTFHWSRKPLYFYINIIVPSTFMGLITLGVFWLPAECGEKMSLGITVVLAFSVFQIVIMEITPVSSDAVPRITQLVLSVMTLATASLISSMYVAYLSGKEYPPPWWMKKMFLYYIPKITRMSSYKLFKIEMTGDDATPAHWKVAKDQDVYKKYFVEDTPIKPISPTRLSSSNMSKAHANDEQSKNNSKVENICLDEVHMMEEQTLKQPNLTRLNNLQSGDTETVHTKQTNELKDKKHSQTNLNNSYAAEHPKVKQNGAVASKRQSHQSRQQHPIGAAGKDRKERVFMVKDLKEILTILEGMKARVAKEEEGQTIREEWKYIGRAVDRLIFWICVIVFVIFIVYIAISTKYGDSSI